MKKISLTVALAVFVAACGSGEAYEGVASLEDTAGQGEATSQVETTVTAGDTEEAVLALTACLREQGVDVPDPTVDADGNVRLGLGGGGEPTWDEAEMEAAAEACAEYFEAASLGFSSEDRTQLEDQLLEYASCMRDNGYDMPDPDFATSGPGRGPGGGIFGSVDRDDPAFIEAQAACEGILAGFGPGSRSSEDQ